MKVIIAGGSGYIGRHLTARLLDDGHEPVILTRNPARAAGRLPSASRVVAWDPSTTDADWMDELVGASAVVNLAGESLGRWPWSQRTKRSLRNSRLAATQALVDAIASVPPAERPGVLVNASGVDIYEGRDAQPATEDTPAADTFLGRLCVDWEAAASAATSLHVRVVVLRCGVVLGRHAAALERLRLPFRFLAGGHIGSGAQWVSWISLADAIELYVRAIRCWEVDGPLNAVAPQPIQQRDFAATLGRILQRPARLRVPETVVRLVLGEQATLVLGSRRARPAKVLAQGFEFRHPARDDALRSAFA